MSISLEQREQIHAILAESNRIAIVTHIHPDGDAIGSMLGLTHILRSMGKTIYPYVDGNFQRFAWLPGAADINATQPIPEVDCVFVVDISAPERMGAYQQLLAGTKWVVIDHHEALPDAASFGHLRVVDPGTSSTSTMLYEIFSTPPTQAIISLDAATCLHAGILSDTDRFQNSSTDARAHDASAALVRLGSKSINLSQRLFTRPYAEFLLSGLASGQAKLLQGGVALYAEVTQKMIADVKAATLEQTGVAPVGVTGEEMKNKVLEVEGPQLFVVVFERGPQDCKISVRAPLLPFDANEFCQQFGGRGHIPAAGVEKIEQPLHVVRQMMYDAIAREVTIRLGNECGEQLGL